MIKDTKRAIVIGTSEASKDFLKPLLDSIKDTKYDILVVSNGGYTPDIGYFCGVMKDGVIHRSDDWSGKDLRLIVNNYNGWELAVIDRAKENYDEFIHIHDTCLIKDISLFDKLFAIEGNVVLTKGNFHYMGKFVTSELPNLPRVHDKATAIMLETTWLDGFKFTEFQPDLPAHTLTWEEIHGMKRMRLENEYMIKWKGTAWISPEQLKELEEQELDKINKKYPK